MVKIWVYCDPLYKFGRPKILQLPILGTQFLNPGKDPAYEQFSFCYTYTYICILFGRSMLN